MEEEYGTFKGANKVKFFFQKPTDGDEEQMLIKDDLLYTYNRYDGLYEYCRSDYDQKNIDRYTGYAKVLKISENALKIDFTSEEPTTYLGRECTKFINKKHVDNTYIASYDVDAYYIVDKATKLCLKYENTTSYYDDKGDITSTASEYYTITSFKVGNVSLNDELNKIVFNIWVDENFLKESELSMINKPNGEFVRYTLSTDEDTLKINNYCGTFNLTLEESRKLAENFFNAGAKYDYEGNLVKESFNELFNYDSSEGSEFAFYGYTKNNDYVYVIGYLLENGLFEVEINI